MLADAFFRGIDRRATKIDPIHPGDPALANWLGGRASASGVSVSDEVALTYTAIAACIKVLAEAYASVPLHVYERLSAGGKQEARSHPLYRVLHDRPNELHTSAEFRETEMLNLGTRGNGYSYMTLDSRGNVAELVPLRAELTKPFYSKSGKVYYRTIIPTTGEQVTLPRSVIHHVRGIGWGLEGMAPIDYAREAIGLGIAAERFGARFYANSATPSGVLEMSKPLSDTAYQRLQASWRAYSEGLTNAHKTAILEDGMKYTAISVTPENAQFVESRTFQVQEVARWYRVPLHMIQENSRSTFSNVEHLTIDFVKFTMLPWFFKKEQAIGRDLFGPLEAARFLAEFSMQGLERGDTQARSAFYREMRMIGALSANEIRSFENLNPRTDPGGDDYLTPLNMEPSSAPKDGSDPNARPATGRMISAGIDRTALLHRALLPIAKDAALRLASRARREGIKLAQKHLAEDGAGVETFRAEFGRFLAEHERGAAEVLAPLGAAYGSGELGAQRAAAIWCEWAGASLPAVRDADGFAELATRWMSASEAAGAALLAGLEGDA